MIDAIETSPAEHILGIPKDSDVHCLMSELLRERRMGGVVRRLNRLALRGSSEEKRRAIAALDRLGLWID